MATTDVLNFNNNVFRAPYWPSYDNIYLYTKFGANIFIGDSDMAKTKFKMTAAAILNFQKSAILGPQ